MTISRKILSCAAATLMGAALVSTPSAHAQDNGSFNVSDDFRAYVGRTCVALRDKPSARTNVEQDLFARCNGAIFNPDDGQGGLTARSQILDQYLGVQTVTPQSDGLNRTNRADQMVAARLNVISSQLRGGPSTANLMPMQPYQVASSSDDIPVPSSTGMSRTGKWDGFFNAGLFNTDQDTNSDEVGYDLDGFWAAGGLDYNINDKAIVGVALSYVDSSSDVAEVGGLSSGGETDTTSWGISAYGSVLVNDALEVNGLVSIGQSDFDMSRVIDVLDKNGGNMINNDLTNGNFENVDRIATSSTEADRYEIAIGASYANYLDNGVSITPAARLSYYHAKIDGFTETGADGLDLTLGDQEVNSTQLAIGATVARPISQQWGVLMPYARAEAILELQDQEQSIVARYGAALSSEDNFVIRTAPAQEAVFDIAAGATAQWGNGVSLFGEVSTIAGHDDLDHVALTFGLRRAF